MKDTGNLWESTARGNQRGMVLEQETGLKPIIISSLNLLFQIIKMM